jgi:peroxiredoxin Q/BCP
VGRLAAEYNKFNELNAVLYPITADKLDAAKEFDTKYARGAYPVYYDPTKKVPELLNQQVRIVKFGRMPAMLIVDKKGIVRYAYYSDSMSDIPENEEIFEVLKGLQD